MGLKVKVYTNIKLVESSDDYDFIAEPNILPEWRYKMKNLVENGYYKAESCKSFIEYAYGSHGGFRIQLAELANWKKENNNIFIESNKNKPFYELIYFSDCEGFLDYEISEILYNDFVKFNKKAMKHQNPFFTANYTRWLNLFKLGKEKNNVVCLS